MPADGFRYTKGAPKQFRRSDLERPVTREFCDTCGTHVATRRPGLPAVILKAGTLDDPAAQFGGPQMAIFTIERRAGVRRSRSERSRTTDVRTMREMPSTRRLKPDHMWEPR